MAKTYRSKTHPSIICEAVQWFDTDERFNEVRDFVDGVNGADLWSVDYTVKPAILSINIGDCDHIAEEGDYVVRFFGCDYCVIKKDIFEKQWEQINEVKDEQD